MFMDNLNKRNENLRLLETDCLQKTRKVSYDDSIINQITDDNQIRPFTKPRVSQPIIPEFGQPEDPETPKIIQ